MHDLMPTARYEGRMSPIATEICWHTYDDTHFVNKQTLFLS